MISTKTTETQPTVVFVLGMHRSGTSALAKVLGYAGGHIPAQVLPPNQDNPRGYWEPKSVVELNNRLLQQVDRHWSDPKPLTNEQHNSLVSRPNINAAAAVLKSEIDAMGPCKRPLILKDPRLCRLIMVWREAAKKCDLESQCIIAYRSPFDVAESLFARDRMKLLSSLELWLTYTLEAERNSRGMSRTIVSFKELMADWHTTLSKAIDTAEIAGLDLDLATSQVTSFLDQKLITSDAAEKPHSTIGQPEFMAAVEDVAQTLQGSLRDLADTFEEIWGWWKTHWQKRSPGQAGSGTTHLLPSWHVEEGMRQLASGSPTEARGKVEHAISMAPDIARFHFILGNINSRLKDFEQATENYRHAVELDASVSRFLIAFGGTLQRQGDYAGAAKALKQAVSLDPTAENLHQYGQALRQAGQLNDAAKAFTRALQQKTKFEECHLALADVLERLSSWDAALEHLAQASQIGGETADHLDRQARIYALMERPQKASQFFLQAAEQRHLSLRGWHSKKHNKKPRQERQRLLKMTARLAAQHWAENLQSLFEPATKKTPAVQNESTLQIARRHLLKFMDRFTRRHSLQTPEPPLERNRNETSTAWPLGDQLTQRSHVTLTQLKENNNDSSPLLSVMIPVYEIKDAKWLEECLESVLHQEGWGERVEIVVIDDGSVNDLARSVVASYPSRVRYICNPKNLGLVGNHNNCIAHARGEFVHILHQDDLIQPGFYDAVIKPMQEDPSIVAAFCATRYINAQGVGGSKSLAEGPQRGVLAPWPVRLSEIRIQFPSIVVRRSTYSSVGGFSPGRLFSFDWDLWNHIAAFGPIWYEPRPLACYRVHSGSATYSFSALERVHDAMHTVADMVRLVPAANRKLIGEMAMYKFFHRYLSLATESSILSAKEQSEIQRFLLSGWTDTGRYADIATLMAKIKQT
ncbi:glycosyltransferase [Gilvimarinus sp. 1_MG-2023]|uniref:glycosyltransferase n=1 Tax=Gilvimarinus sp. 1_MG-2023 TaxID=3062638 RepID=UPI0026E136CC|nr:glycosyltransferase [Gilvimarinus sp. 1_MG-2023]MDO6746268.1 glycosyltransferase [Gilvimarinus sp. 1_MG-2023]